MTTKKNMKKTSNEWISITSLVFFPGNPRNIDDLARERLKTSIKKFTGSVDDPEKGFRLADPIIVNDCKFYGSEEGKNWVIGGNQRAAALIEMGQETIHKDDIRWVHINDKQMAISLNIALNNPAMAGTYDDQKLKDMLLELSEDWMNATGFDDDSLVEIIERLAAEEGPKKGLIDDDEIPEVKESICKTGDLWQLGEHRLLCGDATRSEDVERLMDGEKADCTLTDPPYGVGAQYSSFEDTPANVKKTIEGFIETFMNNLPAAFTPGIPLMWEYPKPSWVGAWVHPAPAGSCPWGFVGNNPILFYGKDPYLKAKKGRRPDSIVMAAGREGETNHPTSKPMRVWEWLVTRMTPKKNMLVLDPFGGSGTTLIACEKLNRVCRMMEIDEHYCDIILSRWEQFTGKKAVKL